MPPGPPPRTTGPAPFDRKAPQAGDAVDPETSCLLADRVIDEVDKAGGIMDSVVSRLHRFLQEIGLP